MFYIRETIFEEGVVKFNRERKMDLFQHVVWRNSNW